jgi:hypothetical protein
MLFGFVLSLFITKETIVIPMGVAIMSALFFILKIPVLKEINIFNFMTGAGYLSNDNFLFNQPINSLGIAIGGIVVMCIAMILARAFRQMDM